MALLSAGGVCSAIRGSALHGSVASRYPAARHISSFFAADKRARNGQTPAPSSTPLSAPLGGRTAAAAEIASLQAAALGLSTDFYSGSVKRRSHKTMLPNAELCVTYRHPKMAWDTGDEILKRIMKREYAVTK